MIVRHDAVTHFYRFDPTRFHFQKVVRPSLIKITKHIERRRYGHRSAFFNSMSKDVLFLRNLVSKASLYVKDKLRSFEDIEIQIYSKTLQKFAESLTDPPAVHEARHNFIHNLERQLNTPNRYPTVKPLAYLENVHNLHLIPFGSTIMGTGLVRGDIDISVNGLYRYTMNPKAKTRLKDLDRKLQGYLLTDLLRWLRFQNQLRRGSPARLISTAKIPLLKYTDRIHGLQCDVSIGNLTGVIRSQILKEIVKIEPKVKWLILLVKKWARAHRLNNASEGSFGSYPLTILVLAFCVQREILPSLDPLIPILDDLPESSTKEFLKQLPQRIREVAKPASKDTLLDLFLTFWAFLSLFMTRETLYDKRYPRMGITCNGELVMHRDDDDRRSSFFIFDPFSKTANCSKPVTAGKLRRACQLLQHDVTKMAAFLDASKEARLKQWELVFLQLFKTRLNFKSTILPHRKQEIPFMSPKDIPLLNLYDELIDHFLQRHSKKKERFHEEAYCLWFLEKYEALLLKHKPSEEVESEEEEERSLFSIKTTPIAVPAS